MTNVEKLASAETASSVLANSSSKKLTTLIVIGWKPDGDMFMDSNCETREALFLLEATKHKLMTNAVP